ncbi:hypothetical protein [Kamptonema formosum]|uniref:hypothetical protein n=1 Tax=Kamptonema formosum TaxID=331992 RepID=UPI000381C74B|nr:hypothetical protein [Oscillatoria sp. PCC 10802]
MFWRSGAVFNCTCRCQTVSNEGDRDCGQFRQPVERHIVSQNGLTAGGHISQNSITSRRGWGAMSQWATLQGR